MVIKIIAITDKEEYLHNSNKQAELKEYETQIDQMVYKLYGLTEEEIKMVGEQTSVSVATKSILESTLATEVD